MRKIEIVVTRSDNELDFRDDLNELLSMLSFKNTPMESIQYQFAKGVAEENVYSAIIIYNDA